MSALDRRPPSTPHAPPRRRRLVAAVAMVLAQALPAAADAKTPGEARPAAAGRRAYVDVARALNEVEEGKAAKTKLKGDLDSRQQRISRMEGELKAKKDSFDKQRAVMKPDARAQKEEELQREMYDLQKVVVQLEQELMESQNLMTQEIGKKLRTVVEKIGDRDGYEEIVNTGDTFLYFKRHLDITDLVIRDYNQQFGKK